MQLKYDLRVFKYEQSTYIWNIGWSFQSRAVEKNRKMTKKQPKLEYRLHYPRVIGIKNINMKTKSIDRWFKLKQPNSFGNGALALEPEGFRVIQLNPQNKPKKVENGQRQFWANDKFKFWVLLCNPIRYYKTFLSNLTENIKKKNP